MIATVPLIHPTPLSPPRAALGTLPVQAELVTDTALPAGWAEAWEQRFLAGGHEPSTSAEWTRGLARHHAEPGDRLLVVRLSRGTESVGFVPLVARRAHVLKMPCMVLQPLSEQFNTHSDLLLARTDAETLDALLTALERLPIRWDVFRMSKLLEDSPLVRGLDAAATSRGWTSAVRDWRASYCLPLPASFDAYLAGRSAKFRNHAKRAEKKLRAAGSIEVCEITSGDEWDAGYEALLAVERASWKADEGVAIATVAAQAAFYREVGRAAAARGRLHLHLLRLDGVPIGHNLGYLHAGRYAYLKTTYAAEHRPLSPSTFLRLRLIESLIARGCGSIDFPGMPYEWERQWTEVHRWQKVVSLYPATARGRMFAALDRWSHHWSPTRQIEHGATRPGTVADSHAE